MTTPHPMPAAHHRPRARHSVCTCSRASSPSPSDGDDDAITPAATAAAAAASEPAPPAPHPRPDRRPSSATAGDAPPHFDLQAEGEHLDTPRLWMRMLAVQRRFGCYTSARMDAALEDDAVRAAVPSRATLDLLNDSVANLAPEARGQIARFIREEERGRRKWLF